MPAAAAPTLDRKRSPASQDAAAPWDPAGGPDRQRVSRGTAAEPRPKGSGAAFVPGEGWLAGIDEAGRGPVLGPLVVAGVACRDPRVLAEMGCCDSKALSPGRREMLDRLLRGHDDVRIEVRSIPAETLDEERRRRTLNGIEVERFQDIALALGAGRVIVDAADVDARRFGRQVASRLPAGTIVVSEHKADDNHAIVGAASIVAKVARDAAVAELARRLERKLAMPLGSGYGSDPLTRAFIRTWHETFGDVPEGTRRSWAPMRELLAPQATRLDDFATAGPVA